MIRFLKTAVLIAACPAWRRRMPAIDPSHFSQFRERKAANYPFSQAVQVGHTLYLSGQIGVDPATGKLVEGGIAAESRQTMQNIKDLLAEHGHVMGDLVKCTVMLADIKEWPDFNQTYRTFFEGNFPARSAFAGSGLALGARVEVECIAVVDK